MRGFVKEVSYLKELFFLGIEVFVIFYVLEEVYSLVRGEGIRFIYVYVYICICNELFMFLFKDEMIVLYIFF